MAVRSAIDYEADLTKASFSALLELGIALRSHFEAIVLVGGWAPYLLMENFGKGDNLHIGSIDIDLAIDPGRIDGDAYSSILALIERRGYAMRKARDGQPIPFSFAKRFFAEGSRKEYSIQVDFLTSTDEEMRHRHMLIQGSLSARKARGCSIAFDHNMVADIKGVLPGNGEAQAKMKILDITGSIGMKGVALGERYKEKDAYDIYSVVANCLDGPRSIAEEVRGSKEEELVKEGISNIEEKFASIKAAGPSWVGNFLYPYDDEMRERAQAECYVKMREFLDGLEHDV